MNRHAVALLTAIALTFFSSGLDHSPAQAAQSGQTKRVRIAVATFSHETCTFCPDPTGIAEWEFYGPPARGDAVLRQGGYIGGFAGAAREYDGVELTGILSPRDSKGGSSGSWVTLEAFDRYANGIAEDIRTTGPYQGVFLALHGAMAVKEVARPEAEIVRRVRKVVGPAVPIMVTLDLHANEDRELMDAADGVFITKRYPHYDAALQGERAARVIMRVIRGTFTPTKATRKPGLLTPSVFQGTGTSPSMEIMERARVWEERTRDAYVSVAYGFAYADVTDIGATVMVVTNNNQTLADQIAQDMSDFIWKQREALAGKTLPGVKDGVTQALAAAKAGNVPVVVADHSDRTGNSSQILAELIRQGVSRLCVATLSDERALAAIKGTSKAGERVHVNVGGWGDAFAGAPVPIDGTLEFLGPYQPHDTVAVVKFGRENRLILTPVLDQVTDPRILGGLHIPLEACDLILIKSRVHFWRGFVEDGLAKAVVVIDAPGLGPADVSTIPYKNASRNIYPIVRK